MYLHSTKLKSLIDKLWNNFWSGGISNPLTAIEQITYLIFMKRLDDLEAKRERDAEFIGELYNSKFAGTYIPYADEFKYTKSLHPGATVQQQQAILEAIAAERKPRPKEELRWSIFKHMSSESMLIHVQYNVFPFLKEINGGEAFAKAMSNAVFIMPKPSLLVEAINIIEEIFTEIERDASEGGHAFQDIQGDVYEMLLGEIATAGKNGQFRTPRHIIKLMAELLAPQLGQRVADPACGTGGFLLGAYQYVISDLVRRQNAGLLQRDEDGFERAGISAVLTEQVKTILQDSFFGFDIDTTMVRLGLMNLMMHGIDQPHIDYKDTLSKSYEEAGQYDVVMANPPFTGNIDKGDINQGLSLPTTKTELLFVERIFTMLKTGGTAAVIVPQGVLFGSGKAFVQCRQILIDKAELKAVISMPSGVFKPYAGVSTAILIFTKGGETTKTWFYDMRSDGYSLDDKRTKLEGYGDLPDIIAKYYDRDSQPDDRRAQYFFVPKAEIADNAYDLSMSKYKEEVYEEMEYEKPKVILAKLEVVEREIIVGLQELKEEIHDIR